MASDSVLVISNDDCIEVRGLMVQKVLHRKDYKNLGIVAMGDNIVILTQTKSGDKDSKVMLYKTNGTYEFLDNKTIKG